MNPKQWNDLPNKLKLASNADTFKHAIKKLFFNNLKRKEDDIYLYYDLNLRQRFSLIHFSFLFPYMMLWPI